LPVFFQAEDGIRDRNVTEFRRVLFRSGRILVALLTGQRDWNFYLLWCMVALGGYLAKTLLYNLALYLSHKATFQILRDIRKMVQIGRASCRDRVEIAGGAAAWTTKNRR